MNSLPSFKSHLFCPTDPAMSRYPEVCLLFASVRAQVHTQSRLTRPSTVTTTTAMRPTLPLMINTNPRCQTHSPLLLRLLLHSPLLLASPRRRRPSMLILLKHRVTQQQALRPLFFHLRHLISHNTYLLRHHLKHPCFLAPFKRRVHLLSTLPRTLYIRNPPWATLVMMILY